MINYGVDARGLTKTTPDILTGTLSSSNRFVAVKTEYRYLPNIGGKNKGQFRSRYRRSNNEIDEDDFSDHFAFRSERGKDQGAVDLSWSADFPFDGGFGFCKEGGLALRSIWICWSFAASAFWASSRELVIFFTMPTKSVTWVSSVFTRSVKLRTVAWESC